MIPAKDFPQSVRNDGEEVGKNAKKIFRTNSIKIFKKECKNGCQRKNKGVEYRK